MMLTGSLVAGQTPLGVAVSGGSDSTALLVLANELLGAGNIRAVTVDHGLRAQAAQEAVQVKTLCTLLGLRHDTLRLELKDGPDLQARARKARYEALGHWAKQNEVAAIALGHTQDDVAETFLMRLARGSGVDGLAQMPDNFWRDGTYYLRPLLNASRVALQAHLNARGIVWSEDPSNADPRFTRVQMRQAQPRLDTLGITPDRLAQTAHWMRAASQVLEQAADTWIAQHARAEHGDAVISQEALKDAPEETACRVLSRVLCIISRSPYRPRFSALSDLRQTTQAKTLHGCLAYAHQGDLRITQELNAIKPNKCRWTIKGPLHADHKVAPLGAEGLKLCQNWRETALLPRRSLLSSPAIWHDDALIAAPLAKPDPDWQVEAANPLHFSK